MSQDYTEKYLKYKNKYLNLKAQLLNKKSQLGGGLNNNELEYLENLTLTPTQTEVYGRKLKSSFLSSMDINNLKLGGGADDASSESPSKESDTIDQSESEKSSVSIKTPQSSTESSQNESLTKSDSSPINSNMAVSDADSTPLSSLHTE